MKRYTPNLLIKYLIKEFSFSLLIFTIIFSSLIIFVTYIDEILFFKDKEITDNFFIKTLILSLIKSPTLIINLSPFIFLFSGIFFYVKFLRNNEITPMSLSGFSKNFITLVPGIFSLILGILIVLILSPITSELSKYYETVKTKYSANENLIIMSDTGIWIKENKDNKTNIIRADIIKKENFNNLKNISIFVFNNNKFSGRIDGDNVTIIGKVWTLDNANYNMLNKNKVLKNYKYYSQINLDKLKNFFNNSDVFSIWNIFYELQEIRQRGYYGQELVIKLNKYLSLPLLLFSMIILSTVFTIKTNYTFNNFLYAFFGILTGIIVYFLADLSIAFGKSGKIPLVLSVWMPVILIMTFSTYSLLRNDE
tara:strand:+ start:2157 stop:3254 length:1098 start_codon:yes stop_codon:yes gene_type:complete